MLGKTNAQIALSGGTLTLTAPPNTLVTLTCGDKTKRATANAQGRVTVRGMTAGTWTLSITSPEGVTSTRQITIFTDYETSIAFFRATIAVSYPAGSTCTCTGAGSTQTAGNQTGTWTFEVNRAGTYTVTSTSGTENEETSVTIERDGQSESVTLSYNAIPRFNYTGNFEIVDDADNPLTFTKGNWKIRFLTSGVLTMLEEKAVDIFMVGGGGGGGSWAGGSGGGGLSANHYGRLLGKDSEHTLTIGAKGGGGHGYGGNGGKGGDTSFDELSVGGGGYGNYGSSSTNGNVGKSVYEFNTTIGKKYSGTGGAPAENSGMGGWGGGDYGSPNHPDSFGKDGGSGIVIIRNARG